MGQHVERLIALSIADKVNNFQYRHGWIPLHPEVQAAMKKANAASARANDDGGTLMQHAKAEELNNLAANALDRHPPKMKNIPGGPTAEFYRGRADRHRSKSGQAARGLRNLPGETDYEEADSHLPRGDQYSYLDDNHVTQREAAAGKPFETRPSGRGGYKKRK